VAGSETTHTFSTPGNHSVACTVNNGSSNVTVSLPVIIGGSQPSCPTLTPGQNVFLNYLGGTSGCNNNSTTPPCKPLEQITLNVGYWNYSCTTAPTYSWTVDNAPIQSTSDTAVVSFAQGSHTIAVTIDNGNTPKTTMTQTIDVGKGATPTYTFDFSITPLPTPPNSYAFTVTVNPDNSSKPTQWQWNFGDTSPPVTVTAGAVQTHTFPDDAQYTITVTAVDGIGGSVSHTLPAQPARHRGVRH
jgi:PKD repeat protein